MNKRISETNEDALFTILEYTDAAGHNGEFSVKDMNYVSAFHEQEKKSSELINSVYSRPSYFSEDWLIIISSDHGGQGRAHGGTTLRENTTFIVSNKNFI